MRDSAAPPNWPQQATAPRFARSRPERQKSLGGRKRVIETMRAQAAVRAGINAVVIGLLAVWQHPNSASEAALRALFVTVLAFAVFWPVHFYILRSRQRRADEPS
jgi:hypothetical protein